MKSTFHGLEVGKRALFTQQKAMSVTGHNIANANTEGYSRQRVNLSATTPVDLTIGNRLGRPDLLGTGVKIETISRARDQWADREFRNEQANVGEWSLRQNTLEQIEMIFQEPNEKGLQEGLNKFWNAWHDLSNDPSSMTARQVVKESAQSLVTTVKQMDSALQSLSEGINYKRENLTVQVNDYIQQIDELNQEISRLGDQSNDLKDKRDIFTDKLAKLVDIQVDEQSNGQYYISLKGSNESFISAAGIRELGNEVSLSSVSGGEIFGATKSEESIVKQQLKLTNLVESMIAGEVTVELPSGKRTVAGINGLHRLGYSKTEDTTGDSYTNIDLFTYAPNEEGEYSLQQFGVNSNIIDDPGLIAAAIKEENGKAVAGNNEIALGIIQMKENKFHIGESDISPSEFYQQMIAELGIASNSSKQQLDTAQSISSAIEHRKHAFSSVSLDEEMANLIKYQHSFNAAARLVSTMDELLDTLINRLGR